MPGSPNLFAQANTSAFGGISSTDRPKMPLKLSFSVFAANLVLPVFAASPLNLPLVWSANIPIRTETVRITQAAHPGSYSLLVSASPAAFGANDRLSVEVVQDGQTLVSKTLHAGDADLYAPFHTENGGAPELRLETKGAHGRLVARIERWPDSPQLKLGGNHDWRHASQIVLGKTVFASADEAEYIPLAGTSRKEYATDLRDDDWYRFRFDGGHPKLVFFQIELTDRDNLPVDVSIFRENAGKLEEYTKGQDPVAIAHEVQALAGNKFAPRVLEQAGDYYVRVRARHPEYKLRTRVYDPPPYSDPHQAVRTAIDYILGAGDSWFANTPRRGGTLDRVTPVHQETTLCVGCHPSHFSQRAQLYATQNGYSVAQRQQLQFLSERFYNNPRPFYGFEHDGAVWARVISAPANVLSRMSVLTDILEKQVSLAPRPDYHRGITKYLDLYYAGRDQLPPDETNGNTPLVSTFEVAWYSWKTTQDPHLPAMIAAAPVKNMIDLCYQTLALADIDRDKYKDQIARDAERILSLQRPDGQWSMRFEPSQPEVEFQTGHALWALSAAGIPKDNPQVEKAISYLMGRQQAFGGWMDPLQSFENFRTPFRETQFAAVALSSYFPARDRVKGWNSPRFDSLSSDPVTLLDQLDQIWDKPSDSVVRQIETLTKSNNVLIRQATAEALGRLALPSSAPILAKLLADPSKLVERTAAWSLRRVWSDHPDTDDHAILAALTSANARERWGASRIFAHHFATLARRDDVVEGLRKVAASDPVLSVRLQAIRGVWQSWFWNADEATRDRIENTMLASLHPGQNRWIETNVRAAVYNLADENIRYLYNNWVALLPREADRERAIQGRLAIESRLAGKFAKILSSAPDADKKELLIALTEPAQRRADIYDLNSALDTEAPPVYNRVGNDIEQIEFFGRSADIFSRALLPLLDSNDAQLRGLAWKAALLVRETPYKQVESAAGGAGPATLELTRRIDSTNEFKEITKAFHPPAPRRPNTTVTASASAATPAKPKLDEAYFRAKVEPILKAKGEDGYACVNCHATHTRFNATWATVMNVVDTQDPENSLILRKPTSTAESEGVVGAKTTAHGGGRRWPKGSVQYETILEWIKGAKLQPESAQAR